TGNPLTIAAPAVTTTYYARWETSTGACSPSGCFSTCAQITITVIGCDDGNPCTIDTCDATGHCVNTPKNCDDGNACTTDTCDANGNCVHTLIAGCCQGASD